MSEQPRPEVLIARMASPNEQWRLDAEARLIALGQAAVEPLIRAMQHANPSVRMHVVHALARLGDLRAVPAVVAALADTENNGAVAIAAEKALVEWGAPATPALLDAAKQGREAIRARAVRALGKIGGAELEAPLRSFLTDTLPSLRTQAAVALSLVLREKSIEVIAPLLADPDKWVRYGVAEALVKQGSVRGEAALTEAFNDPEESGSHVQFWAEELLDEISELKRTGRAVP